ncbi:MAG: hypothetical protein ACERLB_07725 [Gammaproteobacteria bacterium]
MKTLIGTSRQKIYIICESLDATIYSDKEIFDYMSDLAIRNRKTDIRIIAHDTRVASQDGHFLIRLAQKLPTFVEIRTTVMPLDKKFSENWLIIDDRSYMRIRNPLRYEGFFEMDNRLECRILLERFDEIWEASTPDHNTRRLSL